MGSRRFAVIESKQLDWHGMTRCGGEPGVTRNQASVQFFGEHNVCRIIGGQVVTELPDPGQQNEVGIANDSQVEQVLDCLIGAEC